MRVRYFRLLIPIAVLIIIFGLLNGEKSPLASEKIKNKGREQTASPSKALLPTESLTDLQTNRQSQSQIIISEHKRQEEVVTSLTKLRLAKPSSVAKIPHFPKLGELTVWHNVAGVDRTAVVISNDTYHGTLDYIDTDNGVMLKGSLIHREDANLSYLIRGSLAEPTVTPATANQVICHNFTKNVHAQALLDCPLCPDHVEQEPSEIISTASTIQEYNSRPGASTVILLDFDGQLVNPGNDQSTNWNDGNQINALAANFTSSQQITIARRVSDDFSPWDITITGDESVYNAALPQERIRVIITRTNFAGNGIGGIAFGSSFDSAMDTPCWVFTDVSNTVGEAVNAVSHEVGHTLGLDHDDINNGERFNGRGSGATSWSPLMASFLSTRPLLQWNNGDYANATNQQDDVATIAATLEGASPSSRGYLTDQAGETIFSSAALEQSGISISGTGIIERREDVDTYAFRSGAGNVSIDVSPFDFTPNLDIEATLRDASGNLIAVSNPVASLDASFNVNLPEAGVYYLSVDGVGVGNGVTTGYSDYGSLGFFSISGTVIDPGVGTLPPTAELTQLDGVTSGAPDLGFQVTYRVARGSGATNLINNTLGNGDLQIVTNSGLILPVRLVSLDTNINRSTIVADYIFDAPGGDWNIDDLGTYSLVIRTGEIHDDQGASVQTQTLSSFELTGLPDIDNLETQITNSGVILNWENLGISNLINIDRNGVRIASDLPSNTTTFTDTSAPNAITTYTVSYSDGSDATSATVNLDFSRVTGLTLFHDTFNRPNNTDFNASDTGQSGIHSPLTYGRRTVGNGIDLEVSAFNNVAIDVPSFRGENEGGGFFLSDGNFASDQTDPSSGVAISIDIPSNVSTSSSRYVGISLGQSLANLTGQSTFSPSQSNADLLISYNLDLISFFDRRGEGAVEIYQNGNLIETSNATPPFASTRLELHYRCENYNAGTPVTYSVYFSGQNSPFLRGEFTWSGTNQVYPAIVSNENNFLSLDNFQVVGSLPMNEHRIGDVIGIDFGADSGTAFGWNTLSQPGDDITVGSVILEGGEIVEGIGFTTNNPESSSENENSISASGFSEIPAQAQEDRWAESGASQYEFEFTGLNPAFCYEVTIGSHNPTTSAATTANRNTAWVINDQRQETDNNSTTDSYVTFTDLEPTPDGKLSISSANLNGNTVSIVSALQLRTVKRATIVHYNLDDTSGALARDSSGNGHDGTIFGNIERVEGQIHGAFNFNGINTPARVELPEEAFTNLAQGITIAMWVNGDPTQQPRQDSVFGAQDANGNRVLNIHLPWSSGEVFWDAGADRISRSANPSDYEGQWNHWAFTKDVESGIMSIYLNGVLWHSENGHTAPITGAVTGSLGSETPNSLHYEGILDDFCLFSYALPVEEIQDLMNNSSDAIYNSWALERNLTGVGAGFTNDLDQDNISNLLEFVLNGDPNVDDIASITPAINSIAGAQTYEFTRRTDSTTVTTQTLQYSYDLITWFDLPANVPSTLVTITPDQNNPEQEHVALDLTTLEQEDQTVFARLLVEYTGIQN